MVGESLAIIAVILVMAAVLSKAGRGTFAALTLPLIGIPLVHFVGIVLRMHRIIILFDIVGLLLGVTLCFLLSRGFKTRRSRIGYLVFCYVFMILLLLAYLLNLG